jgi:hypothetical protein
MMIKLYDTEVYGPAYEVRTTPYHNTNNICQRPHNEYRSVDWLIDNFCPVDNLLLNLILSHLCRWKAANFIYCLALITWFFYVPHLLQHETSALKVISEKQWFSFYFFFVFYIFILNLCIQKNIYVIFILGVARKRTHTAKSHEC